MKKSLFSAILGFTIVLFAVSCSKDNATAPPPNNNTGAEGKWVGTYTPGGPSHYFALTLNAGGTLLVEANSNTAPDIANGTWSLVADSVRAIFTYVGGTAETFSLAGKFTSSSKVMDGTLGLGSSTTGAGTFSVAKQ